ncbi:MAG TPA: exopolyphosphatase, partial [Acidimicrobiia bacterium]|nr:exopolyphosphatase [Acidimicrobiia bacterium]
MRVAAVDIGTNSTRLLVVDHDGRDLARRTVITGLGRGMHHTGRLSPEGRRDTIAALRDYRRELERAEVEVVRAVITAVGRSISDIQPFLAEAGDALGTQPEVISGDEEARLSYRGAVSELGGGDWTVVDIGGGSTEIVTESAARSADVGSVRL